MCSAIQQCLVNSDSACQLRKHGYGADFVRRQTWA